MKWTKTFITDIKLKICKSRLICKGIIMKIISICNKSYNFSPLIFYLYDHSYRSLTSFYFQYYHNDLISAFLLHLTFPCLHLEVLFLNIYLYSWKKNSFYYANWEQHSWRLDSQRGTRWAQEFLLCFWTSIIFLWKTLLC